MEQSENRNDYKTNRTLIYAHAKNGEKGPKAKNLNEITWLTDSQEGLSLRCPSFTWEWEDEWAAWERRQIEGWERCKHSDLGLSEGQSYSR